MKKFLSVILAIYLGVILFLPKEELLYTFLNKFNKDKIAFEIKTFKDFGFFTQIDKIFIFWDGTNVASINKVEVLFFLFYDRVEVEDVKIQNKLKKMLNVEVFKTDIVYSIADPLNLNITSLTNIAKIEGKIDLKDQKIKLIFYPNTKFKSFKFKRYLKRQKDGRYIYESSFK